MKITKIALFLIACSSVSGLFAAYDGGRYYRNDNVATDWVQPYPESEQYYDSNQGTYNYNNWEQAAPQRGYSSNPRNYYYQTNVLPRDYRFTEYDNDAFRTKKHMSPGRTTPRNARRVSYTNSDLTKARTEMWDPTTDQEIVKQAQDAFKKDPALANVVNNIQVTSNNGKVTLMGKVNIGDERNAAASDVRNIPGVRTVENQIEIASRASDF